MRRIVVSTFASLDGVIDAPVESTYLRFYDDDAQALAPLSSAGALLLGRTTFQAWRPPGGPAPAPSRTG
jgi:hypothetical protein